MACMSVCLSDCLSQATSSLKSELASRMAPGTYQLPNKPVVSESVKAGAWLGAWLAVGIFAECLAGSRSQAPCLAGCGCEAACPAERGGPNTESAGRRR